MKDYAGSIKANALPADETRGKNLETQFIKIYSKCHKNLEGGEGRYLRPQNFYFKSFRNCQMKQTLNCQTLELSNPECNMLPESGLLTYNILIQQLKLRNTKNSKRTLKFTRTIPGN